MNKCQPEFFSHEYSQSLSFSGIGIELVSNHIFPEGVFDNLQEQITGADNKQDQIPLHHDGLIEYVVSEDVDAIYDEKFKKISIFGPARMFGNGRSLAFTAHYMAECLRSNKADSLLIHAAAIKLPNQEASYLILGEKGAGKTTLALRLCHQYGYDLIGNDQVFIGLNEAQRLVTGKGNTQFNVRNTAIASDPYIMDLLGGIKDTDSPAWNSKTLVSPSSVGINVCKERLPIKETFHIRIDHTQPDLQVIAWQGLQRNLVLHERLGRHITGQATPFQDDYGNYLGSLPLININKSLRVRDKLVKSLIEMGITEIFSPNSDNAVEFIAQKGE